MKVLFDINHPAHLHFFKNPAIALKNKGHKILFTSRNKDIALDIFHEYGFENAVLSSQSKPGALHLIKELITRNHALYNFTKLHNPDLMCAIGGTFIAHVGKLTKIKSLVFYDTENAKLQNLITYPFVTHLYVPRCYQSWTPKNTTRYNGYHELSYLHPNTFTPEISKAVSNGLNTKKKNIFIRTVAWNANHDVLDKGWSMKFLKDLIGLFSDECNIIVSSEYDLPDDLLEHQYNGLKGEAHHVLAFCDLYIGESATMASEAAVLGVPAIYVANTGRGYTDEIEEKFKLVKNINSFNLNTVNNAICDFLNENTKSLHEKRQNLLNECIDVSKFIEESIEFHLNLSLTN